MTSFLPHAAGERHRTRVPGRRVRELDPPGDGGAPAGAGVNLAGAAECCQPVTHVLQSRPGRPRGRVKAGAVVGDRERDLPLVPGQADSYCRSRRMPGGVAQGFYAAEVDGGLDLGRVPAHTVGADLDRPGCLARLGTDGGGEALLGEQRRVDAAGEFAQCLQRAAGLGLELGDQRPFPLLILASHRLSQGQRGGDGQQLVLCAAVDVALDPPPLVVLRGDDPQP